MATKTSRTHDEGFTSAAEPEHVEPPKPAPAPKPAAHVPPRYGVTLKSIELIQAPEHALVLHATGDDEELKRLAVDLRKLLAPSEPDNVTAGMKPQASRPVV